MLICPCIVNQFLKMFQLVDTFFVQYFIPFTRLYMFRPSVDDGMSHTVCHYQML
jgi:hypothetical protein